MDWKKAPQGTLICKNKGIDKGTIVKAITRGADTVEKVGKTTGACVEETCCRKKVQSLLDAYLPVQEKVCIYGPWACTGCTHGGSCH